MHRLIDAHVGIARREKEVSPIRAGLVERVAQSDARLFGCALGATEILDIFASAIST